LLSKQTLYIYELKLLKEFALTHIMPNGASGTTPICSFLLDWAAVADLREDTAPSYKHELLFLVPCRPMKTRNCMKPS